MSVVFDKRSFMRHLESEGTIARPQAEKLSVAFHQAVQETVATKADIARLEARIDSMDVRVDAKLAGVDARMARLEAKLDTSEANLNAKLDNSVAHFNASLNTSVANLNASIANLKVWAVGTGVALFSALSAIRFFAQ